MDPVDHVIVGPSVFVLFQQSQSYSKVFVYN